MKVFLSGKIDETYGAWRDWLFRSYHRQRPWVMQDKGTLTRDIWGPEYPRNWGDDLVPLVRPWPIQLGCLLGGHDYSGPYRQIFDTYESDASHGGEFHGVETTGSHGQVDDREMAVVVNRCREGIDRADMVFAYINRPDCFGTLVEIGYAVAKGKFVALVTRDDASWDWTDFWFVRELAGHVGYLSTDDEGNIRDERSQLIAAFTDSFMHLHGQRQPQQSDVADSFLNIATWTSDPRVRNEAMRMLKHLSERRA